MDEPRFSDQPAPIPGGPARTSRRADLAGLPGITARMRVSNLLMTHDLPEARQAFTNLTIDDYTIVRMIAQEGAMTGTEPALRYSAIAALGESPSATNLNLLTDLARFGEDFYVRGHALLALGATGCYAHLAPVLSGLSAEEPFEQAAATTALSLLIEATSAAAVREHARLLGGADDANRVDTVAARRQETPAHRAQRRAQTSSGEGRPS